MSTTTTAKTLLAICKLKSLPKVPTDQMIITNIEALRLMIECIQLEQANNRDEAAKAKAEAVDVLEKELREYLAGVQHTIPFLTSGFGMGGIGRRRL